MSTNQMKCPNCGNDCGRDEVHNGIAMLYGPWGCFCGWSEDADYNQLTGAKTTDYGVLDQFGGLTPHATGG